jgi:ABC-2 type transport system permease protein
MTLEPVSALKVFTALLRRDLRVARRELPMTLIRTALQPVLLVIVFGTLLPRMGIVGGGYTGALLPGILALTLTLTSIQAVALPMVQDFGWTKEIEDRLLAPVPTPLIAVEKMVMGTIQGLVSVGVVLPFSRLMMGPVPGLTFSHAFQLLLVTLLGAGAFSAFGLLLGTGIEPQHIAMMFSVVFAPMIFFGCTYYPWQSLSTIPALKVAVLVNPLVYVAEGLRGTLTPSLPHMPLGAAVGVLVLMIFVFAFLGLRAFVRRAIG